MKRLLVGFLLLASVAVLTSFPAHAGTHVSVNFGYGYPAYYGHHHDYWGPRYYRPYYGPRVVVFPAPIYYPPPRPVYYPAPVYAAPPAVTPVATQQCTQYNGDATVDGSGQPFYGRACLFTDGRWHIMP